jgi:hypothetical protein
MSAQLKTNRLGKTRYFTSRVQQAAYKRTMATILDNLSRGLISHMQALSLESAVAKAMWVQSRPVHPPARRTGRSRRPRSR